MCSFKSIYFVIFILNLYKTQAEISDKRLCVDPQCKEPVSFAKTLLRYSSPDPRILSFAPNAEVTIYSKEAGSETTLWGAVIRGKRGYVPKHLVREYKLNKKPTLLVDTELNQEPQVPKETDKNNIEPDSVKKAYEVIDGTTIYLNPQESVSPSSTESPILSTALPPVNDQSSEHKAVPVENSGNSVAKESPQKSVVNNVLSSFSNPVTDDTDSDEIEAEEDEDEDDWDEAEEEEASSEEDLAHTAKEKDENLKAQNINSLHNLPSGVTVSPYSLEIDDVEQPMNGTIDDTVEEDEGKQQDPAPESKTPDSAIVPPDTVDINQPMNGSVDTVVESNLEKQEIVTESTPVTPLSTNDVKDTGENVALPRTDATASEVKEAELEEKNKPTENTVNINSEEEVKSVTEPSTGVEEEQLPILEDRTTQNPVNSKYQGELKTEEVHLGGSSKENINEGIKKSEFSTDSPQTVPEEVVAPVSDPVPSTDPVPEVSPFSDSGENTQKSSFPPHSLFNFEKKEVIPESKETGKEQPLDETKKDNVDDVTTETIEEAQKNMVNEGEISKGTEDSSDIIDDNKEMEENTSSENEVPSGAENGQDSFPSVDIPASTEDQEEAENIVEEAVKDEEEYVEETDNDVNGGIQKDESKNIVEESVESGGMWSGLFSFFGGSSDESAMSIPSETAVEENIWASQDHEKPLAAEGYCNVASESCNTSNQETPAGEYGIFDNIDLKFNSDIFLLLLTTAGSVIIFLFVYMALDRHKREAPLVARINKLEKELLITLKENELLEDKSAFTIPETETVPNDVVEQLTQRLAEAQFAQQVSEQRVIDLETQLEAKAGLEEQIESLEKELETSTEVGMELNRIISEMLDPTNGSDKLKENVEQFQRQLLQQRDTINSITETLQRKDAENRTLHSDLERSKKLAAELESKVNDMAEKILKIEREKDQQQNGLQNEITIYQQKYNEAVGKGEILNNDNQITRAQLAEVQRRAEIKTKEYQMLKESLDKMKSLKNNGEALKSLLDSTTIKAEIEQLKAENAAYIARLQQEQAVKADFEKKYQTMVEEISSLKEEYEQADKEKVAVNSKLDVLNNYFKKRESELQEEIIKYKSIWEVKEGEATSTTERVRYMQEEIENYKAQNETLKQEIMSQEIDLKSQISVLEKKVHENWVTARQTERKLEDARQEAAQLRNRLTLKERARLQSPLEQNGDLPLSPHPIDSPASPPLLYGARDHITKSPPIPGLPPFLPPLPGAPFMPPPLHGMPPFMPPPPSMFPGDHRPPPLGRMSSPPLNSRYSPDTSAFSPYDRHSPSPPYDSEYGASPPPIRGYSPYNRDDRRDYKRAPHVRTNGRNGKASVMSSGSDHSNDSIDKINRKQSKMV